MSMRDILVYIRKLRHLLRGSGYVPYLSIGEAGGRVVVRVMRVDTKPEGK